MSHRKINEELFWHSWMCHLQDQEEDRSNWKKQEQGQGTKKLIFDRGDEYGGKIFSKDRLLTVICWNGPLGQQRR